MGGTNNTNMFKSSNAFREPDLRGCRAPLQSPSAGRIKEVLLLLLLYKRKQKKNCARRHFSSAPQRLRVEAADNRSRARIRGEQGKELNNDRNASCVSFVSCWRIYWRQIRGDGPRDASRAGGGEDV